MRRSHSRGTWIALVALGLWYAVVLIWAFRPLNETVHVGVDHNAVPPSELSVTIECNNLFSSTVRSKELPVLPPQPDGQQQLAFPREPCEFLQADARRAFAVDTVVVVLAAIGLLWFELGRRRREDLDDRPPVVTPDPSLAG